MKKPPHNVGSWSAHRAARAPGRTAVTDDTRRLSWAEFEERVARLAGVLDGAGISPGDRVALLLGNRSATLETILGTARLGAIAVPINTRLSPREICFLLDDCRPDLLLFEHGLHDVVQRACDAARRAPGTCLPVGGEPDEYERALRAAQPCEKIASVAPDDPMMLMYTSGTTGEPKGALLPHRKTLFNCLNAQLFFGIGSDDRVLVAAPLFHSLGLQILSLPALYAGASLVLQQRFDPERFLRSIASERITYAGGVPTMYERIDETLSGSPNRFDLSSLRFLFTAGAAASVELVRSFAQRGLVLKQGYGQTETSILTCLDAEDAERKAGSVGRPVFHGEVRVVSVDSFDDPPSSWRDVAPSETGEIVVRGPINMLGYWERPEDTGRTVIDGWLRTSDLARVDEEGFLSLVGRARDMYISGGENVYPAEIEAVYAEHPSVRDIAVQGVPDARWGESGRAHVVLTEGSDLDPEELARWGRERLASFKIPRDFVVAAELPRTASGKVQKHLLAR